MKMQNLLNRRTFLRRASSSALTLPLIGLGVVELTSCARATGNTPGSWRTSICSDKEPGEPLIVSGTIYAPDGRTPVEGITLSVYQTDATGVYTTRGGDNRLTRIHGAMRSNAEGKYEFRTIKPGSYPGSTNPAHIHAYISGPGYPEYGIDEFLFDDDGFVKDDEKRKAAGQGSFSPVLKLTRGSDGILRGLRDIKLEKR
jgi:protocatechuate 3,4-dioxygenase, beta subunit